MTLGLVDNPEEEVDLGVCPACGGHEVSRVTIPNIFSSKGPDMDRRQCDGCTEIWGGLYRNKSKKNGKRNQWDVGEG